MEDFKKQLADAHEEVIADIKEKWKSISGGPSVIEGFKQFAAAIDWTEWWIISLLATQAALLIAVLVFRRNSTVQNTVFFLSMSIVYSAEWINNLGAAHWQKFSKQHYFDPQGVFTSAILSAPLVLIMFVILINYVITLSKLLIEMKRKELLYKARQESKAEGKTASKKNK